MTGDNAAQHPLPEQPDLDAAWAELTEAATRSAVTNFQAFTRTGRPWTEDSAAIRAVAATLREFPTRGEQAP